MKLTKVSILLILLSLLFLYPKRITASCNNWVPIQQPNGCIAECDFNDPYCVGCTSTSYICGDIGTNPDGSGNSTCIHLDGCACGNGHVVEQGQTCSSNTGNSNLGYCGDGIPSGNGNCATCPQDYGACPVDTTPPPPPPTPSNNTTGGDWSPPPGNNTIFCQGGGCNSGENCSNCPSDCGFCSCGNGVCDQGLELCGTCALDCGACAAAAYCGDDIANGFETCVTCPGDVGMCTNAWWQSRGGHVFAGNKQGAAILSAISNQDCVEPSCIPYLITPDLAQTLNSFGFAITGGGGLAVNNAINLSHTRVIGSSPTRYIENYEYFARLFELGLNPSDDFSSTFNDAPKPTQPPLNNKQAYVHHGDLTIQRAWAVAADESLVVFVNGQLTITNPDHLDQLITVEPGGFLAFITTGNIIFDSSIGHTNFQNATPNVSGVFISNAHLIIASSQNPSTEKKFVGEGSFVGLEQVELHRDLGANPNMTSPAESFIYRPDFVVNAPQAMKRPQYIWQETN